MRPAASVRSVHAAPAVRALDEARIRVVSGDRRDPSATITVRFAHTGRHRVRPRRRCANLTTRPASGEPSAISRARSNRPERATDSIVARRSGSRSVAGLPSTRRVPTVSFPAASATTARSS
jgi:hypothetical protein